MSSKSYLVIVLVFAYSHGVPLQNDIVYVAKGKSWETICGPANFQSDSISLSPVFVLVPMFQVQSPSEAFSMRFGPNNVGRSIRALAIEFGTER
jgi:hypothetical protein